MKIGEFAKLSSATIRTLRYYDTIGILKPDSIDKFTGYRIYSSEKLEQMRQIQMLKEIGFTLLEIKVFLAMDRLDENGKIEFVNAKKHEIELEKQKVEMRLNALDEFIVQLKEGGKKPMEKKNYYVPFADDESIISQRKVIEEEIDKLNSEITESAKLVKIYAGDSVFGAVDENGKVYIWGNNWANQCDIPENLPPVAELGIGHRHVVALDINGRLHGWGSAENGEISFADDLPKMISIKVRAWNTRALSEDGKVFSWGDHNEGNQKHVPKNMGTVTQIASASYSAVALNSEGRLFSWGMFNNQPLSACDFEILTIAATEYDVVYLAADGKVYGDMGHRELNKKFKPKPEMSSIKKLAAGVFNLAAIDENGKIYVWGEYIEMTGVCPVIMIPSNLPPVVDVAVGSYDILCLDADGKIYAWGNHGSIVPPIFNGFEDSPIFEPMTLIDVNVPCDVYTFEELCGAVQDKIKNITIKGNMVIPNTSSNNQSHTFITNNFHVTNDITITVGEGVTLTVQCQNFFIQKKLINNGTIDGHGRIVVYDSIDGTGNFKIAGGLKINIAGVPADEIGKYLSKDSIYTEVFYSNIEKMPITIDNDLLIADGKTLRLNSNCTLKINEGVTLKIDGTVTTFNKPIINGTVIGEFTFLNSEGKCNVYTFEELCNAVPQTIISGKTYTVFSEIVIKDNIVINSDSFCIDRKTALVIDEGVTLTVNSPDFSALGTVVNNGTINGTGCLYTDALISGTGTLKTNSGLKIKIYDADVNKLETILAEDSPYVSVIYTNIEAPYNKSMIFPEREKTFVTINNDLVIPKGKSLWLHINCILKVSKGTTLKIDGKIETFNEPIVEGKGIGEITVIDVDTPCDVHTFSEFYEAAKNRKKQITVKNNITVMFPYEQHITVNTLIIDKGVTLTGNSCNFSVKKKLINNGIINGTGTIHIRDRIDGESGLDTSDGLKFCVNKIDIRSIDEIREFLSEDSIYTPILCLNDKDTVIEIDNDVVIPKEKSLWLNRYCTLKVNKNATLKVDGKTETFNEPIVEGKVIGNINNVGIQWV